MYSKLGKEIPAVKGQSFFFPANLIAESLCGITNKNSDMNFENLATFNLLINQSNNRTITETVRYAFLQTKLGANKLIDCVFSQNKKPKSAFETLQLLIDQDNCDNNLKMTVFLLSYILIKTTL